MAEARAALQQALNNVINAPTGETRASAGALLVESLQAYLESGQQADEAPEVGAVLDQTKRLLGSEIAPVSRLTDQELQELNRLLPWGAMTVDQNGRPVGTAWSAEKRSQVHGLVESRLIAFDRQFPLAGRSVAELGCFEGIHTLGLLLLGASVTAVDGRIENVLKTLVRIWAYGRTCDVALWNFEQPAHAGLPARWDMIHHVGVLYHLPNPVEHLDEVLPRTVSAVLLDTHVATNEDHTNAAYTVDGRSYRYFRKGEPHAASSPFAGMNDHAKYMLLDDLTDHIRRHGFADTRVVSDRMERHGRRVTIWAFR